MKRIIATLSALVIIAGGTTAGVIVADGNTEGPTVAADKPVPSRDSERASRNGTRNAISEIEQMAIDKQRAQKAYFLRLKNERLAKEKAAKLAAKKKQEAKVRAIAERQRRSEERARMRSQQNRKRLEYKPPAPRSNNNHTAPGGIAACIRKYESTNNYRALNSSSGASGAYQFMDATWRAVTGLPGKAMNYSPATQDAAFWKLWNGGRGARNWVTAPRCGY